MSSDKTFILSDKKSTNLTQVEQGEQEAESMPALNRKSSDRPKSAVSSSSTNIGGVVLPRIEVAGSRVGSSSSKRRSSRRPSVASTAASQLTARLGNSRNADLGDGSSRSDNSHNKASSRLEAESELIAGLSRDELADLEESFAVFDQNGEGTINAPKLYRVMTSLIGDNPTEAEVQDLIIANDIDGGGTIEFDEYLESMKDKMRIPPTDKELNIVYRMLDRNHSGGINLDDLTGVMRALGAQLSDEDIADMFEAVDKGGEKVITFEEFVDVVFEDESEEFKEQLAERGLDKDDVRIAPKSRNYVDDLDLD